MTEFFSERNNLISTMNNNFTSAFRSAIVTSFFNQYNGLEEGDFYYYLRSVMDIFGIDQKPQVNENTTLRYNKTQTLQYFKDCPWYQLFDFIEYVLRIDTDKANTLSEKYNLIFKMHGCKYRLVNGNVINIANELEIQELNKAMNTGVDATDKAYKEAIVLLSERSNPDYNAVIAKASNALESMVLAICKDNNISTDTLGKAINELENKGIVFDQDMKALIKRIYAYACNAGIRHGGIDPVIASEEDAILVLVICAAAINYLNLMRTR